MFRFIVSHVPPYIEFWEPGAWHRGEQKWGGTSRLVHPPLPSAILFASYPMFALDLSHPLSVLSMSSPLVSRTFLLLQFSSHVSI